MNKTSDFDAFNYEANFTRERRKDLLRFTWKNELKPLTFTWEQVKKKVYELI